MCMTKKPLSYPDLNLAFVGARNATDLNNSYIKILESTGIHHHTQYAAKLREFSNVDKKKSAVRREYKAIKKFLKTWSKRNGVRVLFNVRKKDWIGFNAKILLFQKNGRNLAAIRDLLGFKLILETEYPDTQKSHKLAYQLINDLLDFLTQSRHCLLLEAEPKSGQPLDLANKPSHIFIYNKNELKPEYIPNVKNYLIEPKEDFYQGLHTYIQTPEEVVLEIQIHTISTHLQAEKLHKDYKSLRYQDIDINLDYPNIKIPGLVFDTDGTAIFDSLGIFLSNFKFLEDN